MNDISFLSQLYICSDFNENGFNENWSLGWILQARDQQVDSTTSGHITFDNHKTLRLRFGDVSVLPHCIFPSTRDSFNETPCLNRVEVKTPETNSWHSVPSMWILCTNFGIDVVDNYLLVVWSPNGFTIITTVPWSWEWMVCCQKHGYFLQHPEMLCGDQLTCQ